MLLSPVFFALDQLARLVSMVEHRLGGSQDAESEELAQLAREVEAVLPTVDAGKAELARWCKAGDSKSTLIQDHPSLRQPLVDAISGAAWSHWMQLCESEAIEPFLTRNSLLNLLGLSIVWSVATAERSFTYAGMVAGELDDEIGDAVIDIVLTRLLHELFDAQAETEAFFRASVDLVADLYPTALAAPSLDQSDRPANALMAQTLELLGPDPSVAEMIETELRRMWRLMNVSALMVVYRAVGESIAPLDTPLAAD